MPDKKQILVNDKIDSMLANSSQLQEQTVKNNQYVDKLMQAVLREAFEG